MPEHRALAADETGAEQIADLPLTFRRVSRRIAADLEIAVTVEPHPGYLGRPYTDAEPALIVNRSVASARRFEQLTLSPDEAQQLARSLRNAVRYIRAHTDPPAAAGFDAAAAAD